MAAAAEGVRVVSRTVRESECNEKPAFLARRFAEGVGSIL